MVHQEQLVHEAHVNQQEPVVDNIVHDINRDDEDDGGTGFEDFVYGHRITDLDSNVDYSCHVPINEIVQDEISQESVRLSPPNTSPVQMTTSQVLFEIPSSIQQKKMSSKLQVYSSRKKCSKS